MAARGNPLPPGISSKSLAARRHFFDLHNKPGHATPHLPDNLRQEKAGRSSHRSSQIAVEHHA
jgi:hypothetical protein